MRRTESVLLNAGLVLLTLALGVLGYGFVTRLMHPPTPPSTVVAPVPAEREIVQVEVLNGTGTDGLAARARDFLRDAGGFDVVGTGNAPDRAQARTRVLDRVGDRAAALRVAAALGVDEDAVVAEARPDLFVDATVVLGADYRRLAPFRLSP